MVRSTLPPFGLASTCPGGVEMAFWDLKRWVNILDFDARFHEGWWADFKKTKWAHPWCEALCLHLAWLQHVRVGSKWCEALFLHLAWLQLGWVGSIWHFRTWNGGSTFSTLIETYFAAGGPISKVQSTTEWNTGNEQREPIGVQWRKSASHHEYPRALKC